MGCSDFSRLKNQVYVGIHSVSPIHNYHPYFHCSDDFGTIFTISTMRLPIDKSKNLERYNYIKEELKEVIHQNIIRYIHKEISINIPKDKREQIIKDYLKTAYNICDNFFEEQSKEEINNNKDKLVNVGNINEYQKKLGKMIK